MGSMFRLVSRRDAVVGLALLLVGIEAFKLPAAPRLRPSHLAMSEAFPSLPPAGENRGASGGSDDGSAPVLTTRFRRSMQLSFTCNMCETRNKKMINRTRPAAAVDVGTLSRGAALHLTHANPSRPQTPA